MIKSNVGFKRCDTMTGFTLPAEFAVVYIVFLMTGDTLCWWFLLHRGWRVTGLTRGFGMSTAQWPASVFTVIEMGAFPPTIVVTSLTLVAQCTFVLILFLVAGKALRRRLRKSVVRVASTTLYLRMTIAQMKGGRVVIE